MRYARSATCGVRRPSFLQSSSVAAACAAAAATQNSQKFRLRPGALPRRPMAAPLSLDAVSKIVRPGALRHCKDAGQNLAYPPTSGPVQVPPERIPGVRPAQVPREVALRVSM